MSEILKKVDLRPFLETVVEDSQLHPRWLETLSLLENMGARKIHKSMARFPAHLQNAETVLQHAAEEARHAYFFKKQIGRLLQFENNSPEKNATESGQGLKTSPPESEKTPLSPVSPSAISETSAGRRNSEEIQEEQKSPPALCKWAGIKYFQSLDALCQDRSVELLPKSSQYQTFFSYLAVTYIIEERAVDVYRDYEALLREKDLPIHLSGILKEEEGHMQEIRNMAGELPVDFEQELQALGEKEAVLFQKFAESLSQTALTEALL